ncbi:MarR family transcriptional regulator, partial [Rhodococcus hoagii]|nr:MarR family transcriptional regulator [Prescottella equi]
MTGYDDLDMFGGLDASTLPPRQQRILLTIRDWVDGHGCPPSTREIADAVGLRSTSTVSKHLKALEDKGFLRRGGSMTRQ